MTCTRATDCAYRDTCTAGACQPTPCDAQTFVYDPQGRTLASVHVAGDFNHWAATIAAGGLALTYDSATHLWSGTFAIGAGHHTYKLVLDEQHLDRRPAMRRRPPTMVRRPELDRGAVVHDRTVERRPGRRVSRREPRSRAFRSTPTARPRLVTGRARRRLPRRRREARRLRRERSDDSPHATGTTTARMRRPRHRLGRRCSAARSTRRARCYGALSPRLAPRRVRPRSPRC